MDNLGILIQAILSLKDTEASKKQIASELPTLESKLQSNEKTRVKIIVGLNIAESAKLIRSQLKDVSSQLKKNNIKVELDINSVQNAINNVDSSSKSGSKLQIFDSKKLEAEGRKYFTKTTDIIDRVKKYYQQNGALSVDITSLETTKGQVQSFTAVVEDSSGVIKKFNYERAKIDTGGAKSNHGFVQVNSSQIVDKNAGTNLKTTLNFLSRIDEKIASINSKATKQSNPLKEGTVYYENYNTKLTETLNKIAEITNSHKTLSAQQKNEIRKMVSELDLYRKEQQELASGTSAVGRELENAILSLNKLYDSNTFSKNTNNPQITQTKTEIASLKTEYQNLLAILQTDATPQSIENVKTKLVELEDRFETVTTSAASFENQLEKDSNLEQLTRKVSLLTQQIKAYQSVNTKANKTYGGQFKEMLTELANPNIDEESYKRLAKQFQTLKYEINAAGKAGKTFGQRISEAATKFSSWMSITTVISSLWREMRKMITNVKELDTAMASLKRVTDETDLSYTRFLEDAIETAKELKISIADLVSQTAEWAKKGYNLEESKTLAKVSGIYSVVGEVDNATAVQHLTTVMKTYNMTVDDAIEIVDRFNNVSNKYSVSSSDIGEILSNSITSLSVAGNSLDEAIAMGTAITEVTGDSSEAGNTLKVLSMRLRGASTEIEAMGESTDGMAVSTSKLRAQLLALTNVDGTGGFDILTNTGEFKSTYEIMQGIANVWQDMSDVNQAKCCLCVQKCA